MKYRPLSNFCRSYGEELRGMIEFVAVWVIARLARLHLHKGREDRIDTIEENANQGRNHDGFRICIDGT